MDGQGLVENVRGVIDAHLRETEFKVNNSEIVGGIFVTLNKEGALRGCIGIPSRGKLGERLKSAAVGVTEDPRFPPLKLEELEEVTVEVSILTEPMEIESPKNVVVGKHGIIVRRGFKSGLLLPQVPVDQGWTLEEYLNYGCIKAGLPQEAWKDSKTQIFVFEAKVFEETSPKGNVKQIM
ncbi:MAG: TIGR00296 family protein [Candidatus Altiarchaeota archaeon]|nr:TIGR00296 family protein [Candidatus Altiarchaeota archaeon]